MMRHSSPTFHKGQQYSRYHWKLSTWMMVSLLIFQIWIVPCTAAQSTNSISSRNNNGENYKAVESESHVTQLTLGDNSLPQQQQQQQQQPRQLRGTFSGHYLTNSKYHSYNSYHGRNSYGDRTVASRVARGMLYGGFGLFIMALAFPVITLAFFKSWCGQCCASCCCCGGEDNCDNENAMENTCIGMEDTVQGGVGGIGSDGQHQELSGPALVALSLVDPAQAMAHRSTSLGQQRQQYQGDEDESTQVYHQLT